MTAPAFILEAETAYNATTPKTTAAFNVLQGDVLVTYAMTTDVSTTLAISNSGLALAWTARQTIAFTGFCWVAIWTHVVTQSRAGITITLTPAGANNFGGDVLLFRGSDGIGASSQAHATGIPSVSLTTTSANSTIVVANSDWVPVDGASRAWLTNAGPLTETTYSFLGAGTLTAYGGYHADAGPIGTYAVGLSSPGGQTYAIVAVEVLGQVTRIMHVPIRQRLRW